MNDIGKAESPNENKTIHCQNPSLNLDRLSNLQERFTQWFSSKNLDEKSQALMIDDPALVETILHYFQSTTHHTDAMQPSRKGDFGNTDEFFTTLQEIETTYASFDSTKQVSSMEPLPLKDGEPDQASTSIQQIETSEPISSPCSVTESITPDESPLPTSMNDTPSLDVPDAFNSNIDSIVTDVPDSSEEFRIQGSTDKEDPQPQPPKVNETPVASLSTRLNVVLPSVLHAIYTQGSDKNAMDLSPILILPPDALKECEKSLFCTCFESFEGGEDEAGIIRAILRSHASDGVVSSSAILISGLESAAIKSFLLSNSNGKHKPHSPITVCQSIIEEEPEAVEIHPAKESNVADSLVDGILADITKLSSGISKESAVQVNGLVQSHEKNLLEEIKGLETLISKAEQKEQVELLKKKLNTNGDLSCLPLIPLCALTGVLELSDIDECIRDIISNAKLPEEKVTNGKADVSKEPLQQPSKETEEISETQTVISNSTKKSKKKKKKKKKKSSNNNHNHEAQPDQAKAAKRKQEEKPPGVDVIESILASAMSTSDIVVEQPPAPVPKPTINDETSVVNSVETVRTENSTSENIIPKSMPPPKAITPNESIRLSRVEGVSTTCVVVARPEMTTNKKDMSSSDKEKTSGDDDQWETVESRSRSNRRKSSETRNNQQQNNSSTRKVKSSRTPASRRRNANRKVARDIVSSILDKVDLEVKRKRRTERAVTEDRKVAEVRKRCFQGNAEPKNPVSKASSMRDVVLGKHLALGKKSQSSSAITKPQTSSPLANSSHQSAKNVNQETKTGRQQSRGLSTKMGEKNARQQVADQNTATTSPDTLSGNSAVTNSTDGENNVDGNFRNDVVRVDNTAVEDSSSIEGEEATEREEKKALDPSGSYASPPPPLQTLLGPGNTNSASSSVASSLEAPHTTNHRHHHHHSTNENDVGYHLLDVCGRLSRDMRVFMERRNETLSARRRERGALMTALQDVANNVFIAPCQVELYGSCATQLDLPSSDIDAVIRFVEIPQENMVLHPQHQQQPQRHQSHKKNKGKKSNPREIQESPVVTPRYQTRHSMPSLSNHSAPMISPMNPYAMMPIGSVNGDLVMLLAAELERQPWAVQVKAIPTATVPVVKMLADPSRLPGAVPVSENWMMHQHHMAAAGVGHPSIPNDYTMSSTTMGMQTQAQYQTHPWRGADVLNGLFSVDITFEGAEHRGLLSTTYSAKKVQDACKESNLPPEETPFVQVLMVLKELLAQRRLNEPFSGGLSSYALLVLLVAITKERRLFREEMERIERHRLALCGSVPPASSQSDTEGAKDQARENVVAKSDAKRYQEGTVAKKEAHRSRENTVVKSEAKRNAESAGIKSEAKRSRENTGTRSDTKSIQQTTRQMPIQEKRAKNTKVERKESSAKGTSKNATTATQKPSSAKSTGVVAAPSSWASIARKHSTSNKSSKQKTAAAPSTNNTPKGNPTPKKKNSFAEAVAGKGLHGKTPSRHSQAKAKQQPGPKPAPESKSKKTESVRKDGAENAQAAKPSATSTTNKPEKKEAQSQPKQKTEAATQLPSPKKQQQEGSKGSSFAPAPSSSLSGPPSLFPQGSNDIMEVLCSGETTAGKLLMHFLLHYGEHFDARNTIIDVEGWQHPESGRVDPSRFSPFMDRFVEGTIDPVTGMFTVDPIVVVDPVGENGANCGKRCLAWTNIKWHFAHCYMTLSSAIERSGTPPTTPATDSKQVETHENRPSDMVSPLLELLLSF